VEEHKKEDLFEKSFELQVKYGLLAIDSVILSTALRIGGNFFITTDKIFSMIEEMAVLLLTDITI